MAGIRSLEWTSAIVEISSEMIVLDSAQAGHKCLKPLSEFGYG